VEEEEARVEEVIGVATIQVARVLIHDRLILARFFAFESRRACIYMFYFVYDFYFSRYLFWSASFNALEKKASIPLNPPRALRKCAV
jgi:ABC-type uncharacterized transport system permease subunit